MSNLIRNGGFETGGLDFWENAGAGTLTVTDADSRYGTYSGRIESSASQELIVQAADMLPVTPFTLMSANIATKTSDFTSLDVRAVYYDSDYQYIGYERIGYITPTGGWDESAYPFVVLSNAFFCKIAIRCYALGAADVVLFDAVSLHEMTDAQLSFARVAFWQLSNLTASGDTSDDPYKAIGYHEYHAVIECDGLAGTAPTLDVNVCEKDPFGNERILGSFAQITATVGTETIAISKPLAGTMYVTYTEGGTWTDCDFKVAIYGSQ